VDFINPESTELIPERFVFEKISKSLADKLLR
jgi:hypothetical protein